MTQRVLDQEPDTIVFIPDFPDYLVVGTYSLISKGDDDSPAARKGSLQILPLPDSSEQTTVALDRKDFAFGIYDVSFHPRFRDVLGVATSDGELLLYRIVSTKDSNGQLKILRLEEVGKTAGDDDDGSDTPNTIITQLQFIDCYSLGEPTTTLSRSLSHQVILIAATTQSGNTNLIKIRVSNTNDLSNPKIDSESTQLQVVHSQSFNLEAWTVLPIFVHSSSLSTPNDSALDSIVLISGGDDSQLLVSQIKLGYQSPSVDPESIDLDEAISSRVATDRRTHEAGIVATCLLKIDLPEFDYPLKDSRIFVTGSYDEKIRLFLLKLPETDHGRCEVRILSEFAMPGSVWRIMLLDCYIRVRDVNCLFLIAGHTAGAFIVRLTCTPLKDNFAEALSSWHYTWKIEKHFTQHQSLVYAAAARPRVEQRGMWQVISTSFYDKLICEWEWEDCEWRSQSTTVRHPRDTDVVTDGLVEI